jgi:hypothetical protein
VPRGQCDASLRPYFRLSRPEPLLCLSSSSSIVLKRLSGPLSRPTTSQKIWWESNPDLWIRSRELTTRPQRRSLTLHKHIFAKLKQLGITLTKMYWLLGRESKHSTSNKLLIYKTIFRPIWAYGIQLWGTSSTSNTEILERFQAKALRIIVDALWYVPNTVIRRDLQTPTVKEEIRRYSSHYSARLRAHPNDLALNLMELPDNRRLRRHLPNDLPIRFLVQLSYL